MIEIYTFTVGNMRTSSLSSKDNVLSIPIILTVLLYPSIAGNTDVASMAHTRPAASPPTIATPLPVVHKKDIHHEHQEIADRTLKALNTTCVNVLKNFYVRYDNPKNRGLSSKSSIILTGHVPPDEFRALLLHEFGHVIDLGCLTGDATSGASRFRDGREIIYKNDLSIRFYEISWVSESVKKSLASHADFVSGYAATDPFEDFAESVAYYLLQPEAFHIRAKTNEALAYKLRWIEDNVLKRTPVVATGRHRWRGRIPWDVTKLPYVWHDSTHAASASRHTVAPE